MTFSENIFWFAFFSSTMTSKQQRSLLISGWLKLVLFVDEKDKFIPEDIMKSIEEFYPLFIEFGASKLGLTDDEKMHLTEYLFTFLAKQNPEKAFQNLSATLLYDGERDGHGGPKWHKKVNGHYNTLTLVESDTKHIFGGFAVDKWHDEIKYSENPASFLCLIRSKYVKRPEFAEYVQTDQGVTGPYNASYCGPCFGTGFDIGIFAGNDVSNYAKTLPNTPYPGFKMDGVSGGIHFRVVKIETYRIDMD